MCLRKSALHASVRSKDDPWEELACEPLRSRTQSSTRFSLNSDSHSSMSEWYGSLRTCSWFSWSVYSTTEEYGSLRTCLSTFSLDTVTGEWSEWSISWPESVMDVEENKLEEELVDEPITTIGTTFSVLHCVRIPFWMRCGLWPLIHSYEYPCSSHSFFQR